VARWQQLDFARAFRTWKAASAAASGAHSGSEGRPSATSTSALPSPDPASAGTHSGSVTHGFGTPSPDPYSFPPSRCLCFDCLFCRQSGWATFGRPSAAMKPHPAGTPQALDALKGHHSPTASQLHGGGRGSESFPPKQVRLKSSVVSVFTGQSVRLCGASACVDEAVLSRSCWVCSCVRALPGKPQAELRLWRHVDALNNAKPCGEGAASSHVLLCQPRQLWRAPVTTFHSVVHWPLDQLDMEPIHGAYA